MGRPMTGEGQPSSTGGLPPELAERIELRWQQAYGARSEGALQDFYADWAETYDEDHAAIGCFHHETAADLLGQHLPNRKASILDVGAGTGLVGEALRARGFANLTAVDFSPEILAVARRKGLYSQFLVLNLNRPLEALADAGFDAAIAVGVFSYGQVEAAALDELVRVVRPGGLVALTMRLDFHDSNAMGVAEKLERLAASGAWRLEARSEPAPYLPRKEPDVMFRTWLYRLAN